MSSIKLHICSAFAVCRFYKHFPLCSVLFSFASFTRVLNGKVAQKRITKIGFKHEEVLLSSEQFSYESQNGFRTSIRSLWLRDFINTVFWELISLAFNVAVGLGVNRLL